jgi:hypothetical protein
MGEERKYIRFWCKSPKERVNLKDHAVEGRILGSLAGSVEWIQLAQDMGRWQALVHTVMNLRVLAPRSYLEVSFVSKNTELNDASLYRGGSQQQTLFRNRNKTIQTHSITVLVQRDNDPRLTYIINLLTILISIRRSLSENI